MMGMSWMSWSGFALCGGFENVGYGWSIDLSFCAFLGGF